MARKSLTPTQLDRKVVADGNAREWAATLQTRIEEVQHTTRMLLDTFGSEDLTKADIEELATGNLDGTKVFDTDLGATLANLWLCKSREAALKALVAVS